jgi:hypothetical protein
MNRLIKTSTGICLASALVLVTQLQPIAFAETVETLRLDQPEIKSGVEITKQVLAVKDYQIDAIKSPVPLNSRIGKAYSGYTFVVSNNSKEAVELLHAEIMNGVSGQSAALGAQQSSAAAIGATIGGGFLLGIVTFGITFLASLLATPFIYGANHHANTKATAEGVKFPNQVPTGIINPGENIQFACLTPIGQNPQVKMTFRNIANNELFSITK